MSRDAASKFSKQDDDLKVFKYIEEWKSRLIDLSRRNRLLYFKHAKKGNLLISSPNSETVFNKLVLRKRSLEFWMPPEEQNTAQRKTGTVILDILRQPPKPLTNQLVCDGVTREELEKMLRKLNRRSLLDYRERGVRILYAAFGMLSWKEIATNEEVRSPLVMVPLELSRKSVLDPFTISVPLVEEAAVPNPALQVKLKTDYKVELPPFPENGESSLTDYFNSVTWAVEKLGWKVEPTLVIGLFSFHKLVIYKDLEANANAIVRQPIIRAIAGVKDAKLVMDSLPEEKDVDKIEDSEKSFRVLDADSSQRISIDYALQGQSFVMQGPPGTGKSQTIANIIAECIARGKSVLFVSDKMAALEVVYKRLNEVGLAPFCLELHSSKANKQEVVAELMRCLNEQLVPRKLPSSHEFAKLTELKDKLNDYVTSLHKKHPILQMSPYEVLSELSSLEHVPSVSVGLSNVGSLSPQRMRELENLVSQLTSVWQVIEEKSFPWRGYRGNTYSLEVRSELTTFLENLISLVNSLRLEATEFAKKLGLDPPETFPQVNWLIEVGRLLMESPKPETNWVTHPDIYELVNKAKAYQSMFEWRQATRTRLSENHNDSLFSLNLNKSAEIEQALTPIRQLIMPSSAEDGALLKEQEKLAKFTTNIPELMNKWAASAKELVLQFGLPLENLNAERVEQLSRVAQLCFSENKPEAAWFDPSYFRRVQEIVPKAKKDFQEHNLLRDQIAKTYDDRIYELDLDELVTRYNGSYRGLARLFRPSYHRDQKRIALLTREGRVPKTILKDLIDARRAKALKTGIVGYTDTLQRLLGHFYDGPNTDFQKIEKAIEATSEIFMILGSTAVPENLAKLASHGTSPPQQVRGIGLELQESVYTWRHSVEELSSVIPVDLLPNSKLSIFKTPLVELEEWANQTAKRVGQLLQITSDVLQTCKREPENYRQLLDDLKSAENLRRKEDEFLEGKALPKAKFGSRFSEFNTDWKEIMSVLEWTQKAQTVFGSNEMPEPLVNIISNGPDTAPSSSSLAKYLNQTMEASFALESRFDNELRYEGQKINQATLESALKKVVTLRDRVDDLRVWIDFKDVKDRFSLAELAPFLNRLTEKPFPGTQLTDILHKGVYQEWINNLYTEDEHLGKFRRDNHEQTIADFRKTDVELICISANRVIDAANGRKPQDILIQADDSEIGTLLKESAKKRRLMPIRTLLQRIPNLLPRLKPCLLMSPISVSQFLHPELMKFDLVLYDEASQIVPEDAVGSIYRGKNIVVAGDNKQLPPTSFFQKSLIEDLDWDEIAEGNIEVFDSILDECLGVGLPVKTLRWHYRSRHEGLIAFSNNRFYDGTLITFPAAMAEHETLGVKMVYIEDAVYDRGGQRDNPKEAEAIANLVFEHFEKYPEKTLGVVTFSIAQMETVEEAIEHRLREHPEYEHFFKEDRLEGFFVKNLENVQGDERDVMIFSVGYGRDQQGQMTLNFGPLNKAGGERRLNVAITRAREKVLLVTSIKASDINVDASSTVGVLALRAYLEYAEKGYETSKSAPQPSKFDAALEYTVATEIQHMDYDIIPKVGCSIYPIDMGVVDPANPGCYLLGIECDGSTYRSSNSARDRDRLREQVLRQLGWRIHRIWSPDWVARRESEVRRLRDALDQACQLQPESRVQKPLKLGEKQDFARREIEVKQVQFAGTERIGVPYKVHVLRAVFNPYVRIPLSKYPYSTVEKNEFHFPENRVLQSRLLEDLVREEGPIHFDYAVQRLAATWDVR
jgi:DNA replication protein DnaC